LTPRSAGTPKAPGTPKALKEWRSVQLIAAAEVMAELVERELAPVGITWRQFKIIAMVAKLAPAPQIVVAERLGIDRTTMSEEAGVLAELMLILPWPRRRDGRRRYLELSEHGSQVLAHGEYQVDRAEQRLFGRLGVVHGRRFAEYLARIAPPQRRL
jgi:DNA-binding MarR family transcriptional regulator